MAEARASADGEVLALGYGDDGVEGQGWYLAGADEGLELEPSVRVGRSMGAERAGQPGATVEDLATAAPSALDVQAFNRVLVCPACAKKCAVRAVQRLRGEPGGGARVQVGEPLRRVRARGRAGALRRAANIGACAP